MEKVLDDFGFLENDLWSTQEKCLWNAKLFSVLTYHVQADLLHACSYHEEAIKVEHQVWAVVADETASAVRYGFKAVKEHGKNNVGDHVNQTFHHRKVKVELPVRVDFVGGWSDTPPWSLERAGCIVHYKTLISTGLLVKTWAHIPRGSGLGTSSILAAAVVKGLLSISDGDESNENVARLVLVLEQIMGTEGGWQDQIGGLYPELQERLLVVFTRQVRLTHQVLQKVVTRYLQRDNLLVSSIKRFAEVAKTGREALMNCNIDELGDIMMETWRLHQELDPHCSNEFVDSLFAFADRYCCGYKLVGAGGTGQGSRSKRQRSDFIDDAAEEEEDEDEEEEEDEDEDEIYRGGRGRRRGAKAAKNASSFFDEEAVVDDSEDDEAEEEAKNG
nr:bifunctional fucokinase/fucose pyrophosphorylase [Tanacetum cinerariifolium]